MKTAWTEAAWHDYLHWSHADQRMRARIDELIRDILVRHLRNGRLRSGGSKLSLVGALATE